MQTENPFAVQSASQSQHRDALVETGAQREIAEVQAAMAIAKRFPRDEREAVDRIIAACSRPTLAKSALYSYARGGSDVTGPSIRLAEALAQSWGNVQFGIRELEQRNGESTVEAFAWDIQTNTRQTKVFQVAHKRHTKRGTTKLEDPRDIYEMVANQGARRLRACILGIIPGDVIETAVHQCEVTMRADAEANASPEKVAQLVEAFARIGVTKEQIEKRIQRNIESIQPTHIVDLRKIYASIKDGMSSAADWFEAPQAQGDAPQSLKDKVRARAGRSSEDAAEAAAIRAEAGGEAQ